MPTSLNKFESVFPKLVGDIMEHCKKYNVPQKAIDLLHKVTGVSK